MNSQPQPTTTMPELRAVPIGELHEHPLNARRTFHAETMKELLASIRDIGIKTPLLVRASAKKGFQIIGGHRRYRCAKELALAEVPVLVQDLDDDKTLELMLIDNLQREGLHELEEAEGYRTLMTKSGYSVERIAEKVGRSVKYVYDRVKLLQLIPALQKLFRAGEITAGHAIILARLSSADQKLAHGDGKYDWNSPLLVEEKTLLRDDGDDDDGIRRRAVSVRELQAWVDRNIKLEAPQADPILFPETVATLKEAEVQHEKVVRITHDTSTPRALKDGPRPILGQSWKRADGREDSKTCDYSVIGMVVIGVGRGEAMRVCTARRKCGIHWSDEIRAAKKRADETAKIVQRTGKDPETVRREREEADRKRQQEEEASWAKARPAILKALAAAVNKAPTGAATAVGHIVLEILKSAFYYGSQDERGLVDVGKTGDQLLRYAAFRALVNNAHESYNRNRLIARAKTLGVNVEAIVAGGSPAPAKPKAALKKAATKKSRKKSRKK